MKKKILLAVVAVLIVIQFIRPAKNISDDRTQDISTKYHVPLQVNSILQSACNDCHSNKTVYPWYAEIQPLGWWLNDHVTEGKRELNLSTFTQLPIAVQNHKLEEVIEMVKEREMPLASYTYLGLHAEANLTDEQRELIVRWAEHQMDTLKAIYPADSLVLKRRTPPQGS
jgi:hypothetical protein